MVFDSATALQLSKENNDDDNNDINEDDPTKELIDELYNEGFSIDIRKSQEYSQRHSDRVSEFEDINLLWLKDGEICPIIKVFDRQINDIKSGVNLNDYNSDGNPDKNGNNNINNISIDNSFDNEYNSDDDVLQNMPNFTLGNDENLTQIGATQLFDDNFEDVPMEMNNISVINDDNMDISDDNIEAIQRQIQTKNNLSFNINPNEIISNINNNNNNNNDNNISFSLKKGMNLNEMNNIIEKLENAEIENLTTFFNPKKHGNWAGPDQWYHRRYQMTLQKIKNSNKNTKESNTNNNSDNDDEKSGIIGNQNNDVNEPQKKKRKLKKREYLDFMDIAVGNFIDEKEFIEPKKSFNLLTNASINRNEKDNKKLPKDLQIKPDMFIKLFHRPKFSVWKHWLKQYYKKMNPNKHLVTITDNNPNGMDNNNDINNNLDDNMDNENIINMDKSNIMQQQLASMAVINPDNPINGDINGFNDDNEPEFFDNNPVGMYDDNNPAPMDQSNYFNWGTQFTDNLVDQPRILEKIDIQFSTKQKKLI